MAAERSRRVNAGSNIGKLIQQEINQDEFYTTAYGGFEEASGDDEYEVYKYGLLLDLLCIYAVECFRG